MIDHILQKTSKVDWRMIQSQMFVEHHPVVNLAYQKNDSEDYNLLVVERMNRVDKKMV
ncbi:hypothetical protein BDA99DRAFT_519603, partial [Phascolomyces articulosus]